MQRKILFAVILLLSTSAMAIAAESGYQGLIAPSNKTPDQPPAGYSGVIPGAVPPKAEIVPATATAPTAALPSTSSGIKNDGINVKSADDLKLLSTLNGMQKDLGIKPNPIAAAMPPRPTINGVSGQEYVVQQILGQFMPLLKNKDMTPQERQELAKTALERLKPLRDGLSTKSAITDSDYKLMGFSDEYIKTEKLSNQKALQQLDAALTEIRKYQ